MNRSAMKAACAGMSLAGMAATGGGAWRHWRTGRCILGDRFARTLPAGQTVAVSTLVSAADLSKLTHTDNGNEQLKLRACDGAQWSQPKTILV